MRRRTVSLHVVRCLLAGLALAALPALAAPLLCQQAVKPVNGFYLGVQDGRVLHLYTVDGGHWQRMPPVTDFPLPADAAGLHFNERKIGVVQGTQLHFYEGPVYEGPAWDDEGSMPLPQLAPGDAIVHGLYSTERELLVVGPERAASVQPDGEHVLARYHDVLPAQVDCLFDVLYSKLAVVSGAQVSFYQFTPGGHGQPGGLKSLPLMSYALPPDVDEVTVLQFRYLGIRQGQRVHFLQYEPKAKAWAAVPDIPDFELDKRSSLPQHKDD